VRRDATDIIDYSNLLRTLKIGQSIEASADAGARKSRCKCARRQLSICAYNVRTGANVEAFVIASAMSSVRKMADFYFIFLPITIIYYILYCASFNLLHTNYRTSV